MDFRILGPLEVRADGRLVALPGAKQRALLAVLLLHANESVSAERLALALWGEDARAGATKTVQVHVSRLRKALGDPGVLLTTTAGYRLGVGPDELDLDIFKLQLAAGRQALAAGRMERAADLVGEALALWRGTPLTEFAWAPFAPTEIARLEELHLEALEVSMDAALADGRHAELVAELQSLTAAHPWRERLHAQLILALYRSGRQADALEAYRRARGLLVEKLGIEPGPELHDLHQAMLVHDPGLVAPRAAVTAAVERRARLPSPPNRMIGRAAEVRAVGERLREDSVRVLTLTGPGGVGKTRLALEAARAVEADFADGAAFVSLAPIKRPEDVPAAIVSALAIIPLAGESPEQAVARFLAAKHLLLLVDNCEHLPAAAPFIGDVSCAGPAVTVLATSREPLDVQAERVYPVAPLALPQRGAAGEVAVHVDAVALFCERARGHDPEFELSDASVDAIAEICRRVDGLPLAIELAAARCGLLSPGEIATRLHSRPGGLGAGPRDAPARQQTLSATIDWSHSLLSDDEKAGFARFAVFAGGATVEAAETITRTDIDTLERLVAKNLLVRRRLARRPSRVGMLETIRAYAADRFAVMSERESVRDRHYRYFLALARCHASDRALFGPSLDEHLACLDGEIDNFRAALEWASRRDEAGLGLELSVALLEYWMRRDHYAEAVAWVEQSLRKPGAASNPRLRARALTKVCWPLWPLGRGAEAPALLSEGEAIARNLVDPALLAEVLYHRAAITSLEGRRDIASPLADEALSWAMASGDPWLVAMASWSRLQAADSADELRGRVAETAALLEQAGNVYHHASVFQMVGYSLLCRGCDEEATRYLQRSAPLVRRLEQPYLWASVRQKTGLAALFTGDTDAARLAFREQLVLCRELAVLPAASRSLAGLAAIAVLHDDLERAARLAGAAAAHRYGEPEDAVDTRLQATYFVPAHARFGTDAWDAAVRDGAALSFKDSVAYALDEPRQPARSPASNRPERAGHER